MLKCVRLPECFRPEPLKRMIGIVEKHWPMSVGDGKATRKKKPRILAITTDCCTGCAGSPACIECQKCISKGPDGAFLDGCPWDAIEMVPTEDWEAMHGVTLPDAPPPPPSS